MWKHYVSHVFKYYLFYIMWFPNSHLQLWSFPWPSDFHVQWPNWHVFMDISKAFQNQLNVPIGKRLTVPNPVPLLHSSSFLFKWTSHGKQNLPVPFGNKWSLHIPTQFAPVKRKSHPLRSFLTAWTLGNSNYKTFLNSTHISPSLL